MWLSERRLDPGSTDSSSGSNSDYVPAGHPHLAWLGLCPIELVNTWSLGLTSFSEFWTCVFSPWPSHTPEKIH